MAQTHARHSVVFAGLAIMAFAGQQAAAHPFFWPQPTPLLPLPVREDLRPRLDAARTALEKEAWVEAFAILQPILDAKEDSFVPAAVPAVEGLRCVLWLSAQAEARRLLSDLPAAGMKEYEKRYGQAARDRMREATDKDRLQVYREVASRFPPSDAAAEALLVLSNDALEHGDHALAAAAYGKLLGQKERAEQVAPLNLYRAIVAFRKSGDQVRAQDTWKRLGAKVGKDGLTIDGRKLSLEELAKELDKKAPLPGTKDWPIYRGNPSRTGKGVGGNFKPVPTWRQSTVRPPEQAAAQEARDWAEDMIQNGQRQLALKSWPIMPAFQPLAIEGRLICRTYSGVSAVYLRDEQIEAGAKGREKVKAGDLAWWHNTDGGALTLVRAPNKKGVIDSWRAQYNQWGSANSIFDNSITGTLSTDGQYVFVIDDLAIQPHPQALLQFRMGWGGQMNFGALQKDVANRNTLKALSIARGGSLRFELGGDHDPHVDPVQGTRDSFFLGPPLPLGNKIYVLNEKDGVIRLLCLQANTGAEKKAPVPAIDWLQPLLNAQDRFSLDFNRRMHAAHPAYGDGILVCPTNAGTVLGVDLLTRGLLWAHQYREIEPDPRKPIRPQFAFNPNQIVLQHLINQWKATAPAITEGKVVFAEPDAKRLHCLDLHSGRLLWSYVRGKDDLYFAGPFERKVLIVARGGCRALELEDGTAAWKVEETGMPSGQGVAAGGVYYLPLAGEAERKEPAVLALTIAKGTVVRRIAMEKHDGRNQVPGNLIFADGQLLSQSVDTVAAYPLVTD
jgi:outer membrane protein assembly factor BamB